MKILFVAPFDSLHGTRWLERLANKGHEVFAIDMAEESQIRLKGQEELYLKLRNGRGPKFVNFFSSFFRARSDLKALITEKGFRPDVVCLHWLFHPAALAVCSIPKLVIVSTPWGSDLLIPSISKFAKIRRFFHALQIRYVVNKSQAFTCDAPHMAKQLERFGAVPSKIHIIYFGIDIRAFSPQKFSHNWRNSYGVKPTNILILSNRQLANVYRVDLLIDAIKLIQQDIMVNQIKVLIAGDGPERASLESRVVDLELGELISFLGRLETEEFITSVASSDIYVSTSPTDGGIASSVAEAMASAVPVVISNFGDNPNWVNAEASGELFESEDAQSLASAILKLIDLDSETRRNLGINGRKIIEVRNNADIETLKLEKLLNDLI